MVPGHNNIAGNEKVDKVTRLTLLTPTQNKKITLLKYDNNIGQNRRLNSMKLKYQYSLGLFRNIAPKTRNNYQSSQNRPHLTYPWPYNDKRRSTQMPTCGVQPTIKHILTECKNHQKYREETLCITHLHKILSSDFLQ